MCDQADIGDSWSIAAAEAPGARVTCKYVFDRVTAQIKPVREPLHSSWLIEMKFLFEIFSHARDDKGMRVHSQHLSKPAYMRSCAQIYRQEGRLRIFLLEIFEDSKRLHQRRAVAVEQSRHNHLWIERPIGCVELVALEQIERNQFRDQPFQT